MDKFEMMYDKVRGWNHREITEVLPELEKSVQLLGLHVKIDNTEGSGECESADVTMSVVDCLFWVLAVAACRGICLSCLEKDLDRKLIRMIERDGNRVLVMPPKVTNISHEEDERNFYRHMSVDTKKYKILPVTAVGEDECQSWFCLPIPENGIKITDCGWYWNQLCMDLQKCTGVAWLATQKDNEVELRTFSLVDEIYLITTLSIEGRNIVQL